MGPRDLAEMDELLEELAGILAGIDGTGILKYSNTATGNFRERLAELRRRSSELEKIFPRNAFPLIASAAKKLSNAVNVLVAEFPGKIINHKNAIEKLKTIWALEVRPEIYRVEVALAVTAGVILPEDAALFRGKDRYLREITFEINRCFRNGAYNGCSVLMRRLLETLIIQAHEKRGTIANVRNSVNGRYYKLDKLIDDITAQNAFNLSRNAIAALPKLKKLGDWGAHNRNILVRETDIDGIKTEARLCFEELFRHV